MDSFDHARVLFLTIGALCCGACSGASPEEGEGRGAADSYVAGSSVQAVCAPSHEHFIDLGDLDPVHAPNTTVATALNDQGTVVGSGMTLASGGTKRHAFRWKAETGLVDLSEVPGEVSYASDVNEQEQMVGYRMLPGGSNQAVLWDAENQVHELGFLGGTFSHAYKINNRGQVIGDADDASGMLRVFLWDAETGMVALDLPDYTNLRDINDSGVVVGSWLDDGGYVGFTWTKDGGPVELDRLGSHIGIPDSINAQGEIVGTVEFFETTSVKWTDGVAQILPAPPNASSRNPHAINDAGWVVGDSTPGGQAVEWDPLLRVRLLPLQASQSTATDVNNCGTVTGTRVGDDCGQRAYLWEPERPAP